MVGVIGVIGVVGGRARVVWVRVVWVRIRVRALKVVTVVRAVWVVRVRLRVRGGVSKTVRTLWSQVALSSSVWWRGSAAAMARMCT